MMQDLKKVVLINGSPKVSLPSASGFLNSLGEESMGSDAFQVSRVNVRNSLTHKGWDKDFEVMLEADALVFTFPLYIFCLPGIMMRFLQDYYAFIQKNGSDARKTKVYTIVNCGFPEAGINSEAVEVIRCFSKKIGADFRFGSMVGGGGMLVEDAKNAPFMKKTFAELEGAFRLMAQDIQGSLAEIPESISIEINFPRRLYLFMGNRGWFGLAKKNGLKKKQLYARPYIS
jgi:hypothetical protein